MWILHFLPDSLLLYVVNGLLVVGGISFFLAFFVLHRILNKFPALAPYYLIFQIVSAVMLIAGIYFKGGYSTEMEWREKVAEAEAKVKVAEQKAEEANGKVQVKVVEKIKKVKDVQVVVQERIKEVEKRIDAECKLDPEVPKILNQAAGGNK